MANAKNVEVVKTLNEPGGPYSNRILSEGD
jgi:hypothetical protein